MAMKNQMKIWIVAGSSGKIKELRFPIWIMQLLLCVTAIIFLGLGWFSYDYYHIKTNPYTNQSIAKLLTAQNDEIQNQRKQIQNFASQIQQLKQQVLNTTALENKVRIIADIQKPGDQSNFLGIGGIPLYNFNLDIPLESDHSVLIREMHSQLNQLTDQTKNQKLDLTSLIAKLEDKRNLLASTPTIRPTTGWISSKFGYRTSPFTNKRAFHSGLDIANKKGTKIIATADGKVSFAAPRFNYGNMIKIDHGYGVVTKYAHLSKILVKPGQKVKRGETIGLMGNTGRSTGPHLHYEVVVNNIPVDPVKYILN